MVQWLKGWALKSIVRGAGALLRAFLLLRQKAELPVRSWPRPTGEFQVGTRDIVIAAGGRPILARLWIPGRPPVGARSRPLHSKAEAHAISQGMNGLLPDFAWQQIGATSTASYEDFTPLGRWPLVVFSHGLGGVLSQNTHLCEELASHGYAVASLSHPDGAAATVFPDGQIIALRPQDRYALMANPRTIKSNARLRKCKNSDQRRELTRRHAGMEPLNSLNEAWSQRISAVMDHLLSSVEDPYLRCIDPTRIAVIGMSFGGSASALAAHRDMRVSAAINLDGFQFGEDLFEQDIRCPLLLVHSRAARTADGGTVNDFHYQRSAGPSAAVVRRYILDQAGHLSFTDMALFGGPVLRKVMGTGGLSPQETIMATDQLVLDFLDSHLKGRQMPGSQTSCINANVKPIFASPRRSAA